MEDSDEFKWAVKVVIKRQMRDLMEQLRERGEEIAVLTVNLDDNTFSHFGSPSGEWFVSEQKNLAQNFLKFCRNKDKKGPSVESSPQKATGYSYSSTPGTKSSQKAKRTPASASSGGPTLTVTVPRHLAGDITEEELAAVVGRVVACQLAVQEKGDGSTSGTKFDLLLEAANQHKKKDENGSILSTPSTRSTRKRKLTAKYLEGMSSLKKGRRPEEEDTGSEQETGHDENVVLNMLEEISSSVLKRVKVKTSDETPVNIDKSHVRKTESLETLAVLIVQEIDEMAGGLLTKEKMIQVEVVITEETDKIYVELDMEMLEEIKVEEMDDSDMEYLDLPYVDNEENDEESFIQEDSDIDPDFVPENELEGDDADAGQAKKKRGRPRSKNPKKKRPLAEMRPRKCHHCPAVLTGISSLNSHIKRVHLKEKKYPCHICGYAFFTTTHREDHIISVHTRKCGKCNIDVIETMPWTEGMDKTNIRVVDCSCGNSVSIFSKVGRVRGFREEDDGTKPKRKRAASEITPIDCEQCGLTLTGRSSLYSHIRRQHLKTRNFKCSVCGKEFYTSTHLQCHILSVHTRKCQNCQEFVMETEPWSESMDKKQMRKVTCKCGSEVTICTKLGPKHRPAGSTPKRNKSGESADTRYVCGTCGKIFLKKSNAMSHICVEKEELKQSTTDQTYSNETELTNETNESQVEDVSKTHELVLESDPVQYKMEGGNLVIAEGSQVVTFESEEGQSISDVAGIQIMHEGKLVPAEHIVDEHGNVSFIIKQIE